jgi:hypothetical protein
MVKRSDLVTEGDNLGVLSTNVGTGVSLASFMSAVTIFFVGLLITRFESFDDSIRIPILFLIISTFGFLYSALIYSNSTGELIRLKRKRFQKDMHYGDVMSEYCGVYFLVLSIPLAINAISSDGFLRYSTLVVSLIGLILYHKSGFSVMEAYLKKGHYGWLSAIIVLEIAMFFSQINFASSFLILAIMQLITFGIITYKSLTHKDLENLWVE